MLNKLIPYLIFLGLSLGLAYYATIPDQGENKDEIKILDLKPQEITSFGYDTQKFKLTIEAESSSSYWVSVEEHKVLSNSDSDKDKGPKSDDQAKVTAFKANEKVNQIVETFKSLVALRDLGTIADDQLKSFGFQETKTILTIHITGNKSYEFLVGENSYNNPKRYLLDKRNGHVLLVKDNVFRYFEKPVQELFERRLSNIELSEVEEARLSFKETERKWHHTQKGEKGSLVWTRPDKQDQPDKAYSSWIEKIEKLKALEYANDLETKELEKARDAFKVDIVKAGQVVETFSFRILKNDKAASSNSEDGDFSYWVKTSFLGKFAKVSKNYADSIYNDLPSLISEG